MTEPLATLFEVAATNVLARRPPAGGPYRNDFIRSFIPVKLINDYLRDPVAYHEARALDERLKESSARAAQSPASKRLRPLSPTSYLIMGNFC